MADNIYYYFGVEGIDDQRCNSLEFLSDNTVNLIKYVNRKPENYGKVIQFTDISTDYGDIINELHTDIECMFLNMLSDLEDKSNILLEKRPVAVYLKSVDSDTISKVKYVTKYKQLAEYVHDMYITNEDEENIIHLASMRLAACIVSDYLIRLNKCSEQKKQQKNTK